jgi:hypothetical protein
MCFASIRRGGTGSTKGQEVRRNAGLDRIAGIVEEQSSELARREGRERAEKMRLSSGGHTAGHRRQKLWKCAGVNDPAHEEFCCSGAIRAIRTMMPKRQEGHRRKVSSMGESAV